MPRVVVSREARNDLINQTYIRDELLNSDASKRILGELKEAITSLQNMPERGKPLDSVIAVHTEYRYLVCERYRIFYLSDGETVEVVRILHTLQDYMRVGSACRFGAKALCQKRQEN